MSFVFPNFKKKERVEKERKTLFFFISEVLPLDAAVPAWRIKFSLWANMAELHGPIGWLFHHYQDDECVLHTESSAMKFPSSSTSSQTDTSTHISLSPNPPFSPAYVLLLEQRYIRSLIFCSNSQMELCVYERMRAWKPEEKMNDQISCVTPWVSELMGFSIIELATNC